MAEVSRFFGDSIGTGGWTCRKPRSPIHFFPRAVRTPAFPRTRRRLERLIRHKSNFREGQVMMMKRFGKSLMIASLALLAQASVVSVGMAQEESPVYGVTRFAQYQGRYAVSFPITN